MKFRIKKWDYKKRYWYLLGTMFFMLAGIVSNSLAIFGNDCVMPVAADLDINTQSHRTLQHFTEPEKVKWMMFSDIIPIGNFLIVSVGDILMIIGVYRGINGLIVHNLYTDFIRTMWMKKSFV